MPNQMTFICNPLLKSVCVAAILVGLFATSGTAGTYGSSQSSSGSIDGFSGREVVRRQQDIVEAQRLEKAGDAALADRDLETAYTNYLDALDLVGSGDAVAAQRSRLLGKFSNTGVSYAEQLIANGRYADAEQVGKTILLPQYNPTFRPAVVLLSNLEQSDYYNKTVTPQFAADREEVSRLLVEAEGYYSRGSFDLATLRYEQVLNIDRYNIAARKGIEKVEGAKMNYASSAYNETRSRMLWQVTKAWELPVRKLQTGRSTAGSSIQIRGSGAEAITAKLNRIIVPRIDLRDTTVREAVEYLRTLSVSLDSLEADPAKRGVNIFLKLPSGDVGSSAAADGGALPTDGFGDAAPAAATVSADTRITLALNGVPLYEALRYLAQLAGLKIKVEDFAVAIVPLTDVNDDLLTKEYSVPPTFIPATPPEGETSAFGTVTPSETSRVGRRPTAQQYLASQGVVFPEGASANYIAAGSRLVVRNTQDNIDLIDVLVDSSVGAAPTQVEIESKFVEINQNNLKELGFDWLLGPMQIGSSGAYLAGGDTLLGNTAAYPFNAPGGQTIGQFPVTSGLRSGVGSAAGSAISTNSVDSLLAGLAQGTSLASPGIFALSGIYSNPQFQLVIRALDQKKGIDLMSAPKVTTKSGLKAVVSIVREFIYPTDFDPPQIPQEQGSESSTSVSSTTGLVPGAVPFGGQAGFTFPNGIITPTTPTGFETRNTGVTLDVLPTVGPDGYTIDLEITPEVVDFDGFVNYGSPIKGIRPITTGIGGTGLVTGIETFDLTPNVINQPIFTVRKVNTKVTIWDGSTVALGGLIREDVQKVEDKVPVLGDVPLVGRLFRSEVDQKLKKNLIIFVTARMMDAGGKPVRSDTEEEEIVEPLGLPDDLPRPVIQVKSVGAGK
jgi:general secretion pathway protein D